LRICQRNAHVRIRRCFGVILDNAVSNQNVKAFADVFFCDVGLVVTDRFHGFGDAVKKGDDVGCIQWIIQSVLENLFFEDEEPEDPKVFNERGLVKSIAISYLDGTDRRL
jgi:hypothetical protein